MDIHINYLAVLVAALLTYGVGALWYSPVLFSNAWLAALGKTKEEIQSRNNAITFVLAFVFNLIMAFVMAHVVNAFGGNTFGMGLQGGIWMWLGFVATTNGLNALFGGRSLRLFLIDNGYHLVSLLIMGVIFSVWQ